MNHPSRSPVTGALSAYIAGTLDRDLPPDVIEKAKHHVLDTVAAMISGTRLPPGRLAVRYAAAQGGRRQACVAGSRTITTAVNAALANGMLAHADETDDSHAPSFTHPGCAIVPAALAAGEAYGRSGLDLLRAVVVGYDVGCRATIAAGPMTLDGAFRSTHSIGGLFGAAAAAGPLCGLTERQTPYLLSYTVQQASGVTSWARDGEHIEKAFDFGGMPARNGVTAATMVAAGFTGVEDAIDGSPGFWDAFSPTATGEAMVAGLGDDFEIMRANIKKWPVGSPIQAALDSLEALMADHGLAAKDVKRVVARLPDDLAHIVDNRSMPDINLQHMLALLLVDGAITFANAHDTARMTDPRVAAVRDRVELAPSAELTEARPRRQAIVEMEIGDGTTLSHRTYAVRGTSDNPMTRDEVTVKAQDLLGSVLGEDRAGDLIEALWALDRLADVRELRPLLRA